MPQLRHAGVYAPRVLTCVCFEVDGSTRDARQCRGVCWPCTAPQLGLKAELPAKLYIECTHSKAPSEQARHKAMRGYDGRLCKVAHTSNNYYRARQATRHTADLTGTLLAGAGTLAAPYDWLARDHERTLPTTPGLQPRRCVLSAWMPPTPWVYLGLDECSPS